MSCPGCKYGWPKRASGWHVSRVDENQTFLCEMLGGVAPVTVDLEDDSTPARRAYVFVVLLVVFIIVAIPLKYWERRKHG